MLALAACGGGGGDEGDGTMSALAKGGSGSSRSKWRTGDTTAPTAPTNVAATATSSTSITVTWAASSDDVGVKMYRLYRCVGGSCSPSTLIANAAETSYTDGTLTAGTAYSYSVEAVDAAGNVSARSPIATATTLAAPAPVGDTTAPAAPSGVTATATSSSSITISWNPSTDNVGVVGYRLYRCDGSGCTAVTQIASPTSTSYTDSGLSASTPYSYSVAAADAAGNVSAPSSLVTATTQPASSTQPVTWSVDPPPVLVAGSSNAFDLSQTLPQGVVRGGAFSLAKNSAPLPSGVTLSSAGLLSASSTATGSVSGVVFSYTPPGG
jgi:chitodextrinase